jgi:hypothetical protein
VSRIGSTRRMRAILEAGTAERRRTRFLIGSHTASARVPGRHRVSSPNMLFASPGRREGAIAIRT